MYSAYVITEYFVSLFCELDKNGHCVLWKSKSFHRVLMIEKNYHFRVVLVLRIRRRQNETHTATRELGIAVVTAKIWHLRNFSKCSERLPKSLKSDHSNVPSVTNSPCIVATIIGFLQNFSKKNPLLKVHVELSFF